MQCDVTSDVIRISNKPQYLEKEKRRRETVKKIIIPFSKNFPIKI